MLKKIKVYRTFTIGIFIGLFFALIVSENFSSRVIPLINAEWVDQRMLVLTFFGILGGVIYTIVGDHTDIDSENQNGDGIVELPRFNEAGTGFEAGLFGDILLGIAGAYILDFLLSPFGLPDALKEQLREQQSYTAVAAQGIIGGYTAKALLAFAQSQIFNRLGGLEKDNKELRKANDNLTGENVDLRQSLIKGGELVNSLRAYISNGEEGANLNALLRNIENASPKVKDDIFKLTQWFRSASSRSRSSATPTQIQRMIPVFESLLKGDPENFEYLAQLGYAYKDAIFPGFDEALTYLDTALAYLDKAIDYRGEQNRESAWKYELNRAIARILRSQLAPANDYEHDQESWRRSIVSDLQAVSSVKSIPIVLAEAVKDNIQSPIAEWVFQNKDWLSDETKGNAVDIVSKIERAVTEGVIPDSIELVSSMSLKDIKRRLEDVVTDIKGAVPLIELSSDATEAIKAGLVKLNLLEHPENDQALQAAWRTFKTQTIEPIPDIVNTQDIERFFDSIEKTEPDASRFKPHNGLYFPLNYSSLGRGYDILKYDPFRPNESSGSRFPVFEFLRKEGVERFDVPGLLEPRGVDYRSVARGGMVDRTKKSYIIRTSSDISSLLGGALGDSILSLLGRFIPFSLSGTYASLQKTRQQTTQISVFKQMEYVCYELKLRLDQPQYLRLDERFRQAVDALPDAPEDDAYKDFIDYYGTHFSSFVEFGGLAYLQWHFSYEDYRSNIRNQVSLDSIISHLFKVAYSKDQQDSEFKKFEASDKEIRVSGGIPDDNLGRWLRTVPEAPAPIKMELQPIQDLFTKGFFPDAEGTALEMKRQTIASIVQTYIKENAQPIEWEPWKSTTVGNYSGNEFYDIDLTRPLDFLKETYQHARVTEIRCQTRRCVDRIQFVLNTGELVPHGGEGGQPKVWSLDDPDDYITAIKILAKDPDGAGPAGIGAFAVLPYSITYIEFHTHKNRSENFGERPESPHELVEITAPDRYQIIGLHGTVGDSRINGNIIYSLGVTALPLPEEMTFRSEG